MNEKELSATAGEEKKKTQSSPLIDAFFIGFLIGIVIYSLMANTWGFLTLIPLFMVYALLKKSKKDSSKK